jgi:creatinine amidohydrolase
MRPQLELMRPDQIAEAMASCPRIWLPLGTIEYHGRHLPVGLDGLQAHGLCIDAAEAAGGLVYPPLWWGTGGGHGGYPWTVMMPDEHEIAAILRLTLARLARFGTRQVVLFSGHFAEEQLTMLEDIAAEWNLGNASMRVLALAVNGNPHSRLAPDHAGLFETSLLASYHPSLVDLSLLPQPCPQEAGEDPFGQQRYDPSHSLYGIFGPDPRAFNPLDAIALRKAMTEWLIAKVALPPIT